MTKHILTAQPSLLTQLLNELRSVSTQTNRRLFNENLQQIGFLMGYEISKHLPWQPIEITTPLATCQSSQLAEQPVIIGIMRAGAPLLEGLRQAFNTADIGFVGAFRNHTRKDDSFEIALNYLAAPSLEGRTVIIADPMLATGQSLIKTVQQLEKYGMPKAIHIVSVVGAPEGIAHLEVHLPNATLWLTAEDSHLNAHSYIVPGLGDAGDLCFGPKL
jgi:uracil phosphoribosyltransferase